MVFGKLNFVVDADSLSARALESLYNHCFPFYLAILICEMHSVGTPQYQHFTSNSPMTKGKEEMKRKGKEKVIMGSRFSGMYLQMTFIGLCRQTFLSYVLFCGLVKLSQEKLCVGELRLDNNFARYDELS